MARTAPASRARLWRRGVHPGADGDLAQHAGQPAEREGDPDGPRAQTLRCQDDRDERTDARLHVREEEVQGVEAQQTPARCHGVTPASCSGRDPSLVCAEVAAFPPVPMLPPRWNRVERAQPSSGAAFLYSSSPRSWARAGVPSRAPTTPVTAPPTTRPRRTPAPTPSCVRRVRPCPTQTSTSARPVRRVRRGARPCPEIQGPSIRQGAPSSERSEGASARDRAAAPSSAPASRFRVPTER